MNGTHRSHLFQVSLDVKASNAVKDSSSRAFPLNLTSLHSTSATGPSTAVPHRTPTLLCSTFVHRHPQRVHHSRKRFWSVALNIAFFACSSVKLSAAVSVLAASFSARHSPPRLRDNTRARTLDTLERFGVARQSHLHLRNPNKRERETTTLIVIHHALRRTRTENNS